MCPWNESFAQQLREPAFAAREMFRNADAPTLAREILEMEPADYAAAFKGSAIKRAKLWMLQRNAAVVLENVNAGVATEPPIPPPAH